MINFTDHIKEEDILPCVLENISDSRIVMAQKADFTHTGYMHDASLCFQLSVARLSRVQQKLTEFIKYKVISDKKKLNILIQPFYLLC